MEERNAHRLQQNVIMIGMPGCGKSTVGKELAKRLGKNFRDGDDVIREQMGCTLEDIMNERGPMGFLALEEEILSGVALDGVVFAPGGSCAYEDAAMAHLAETATVVYLLAGYDDISARVGDLQKRGVVLKDGIGMSLQVLYDERHPLYLKFADVIVDETGMSVAQAADAVQTALEAFWKAEG